ncbi:hypothetical protein [Altererythrobacter sp. ZODW24]|uniref:hypothetical protein n=1 Tax=Altererythrobacter sp. ZODW24 TaxID=2185142 RepID=UPI000DF7413B|nr:hypothetical protein [Altererythrobacter sp. ZODW24]
MKNNSFKKTFGIASAIISLALAPAAMAEDLITLKGDVMVVKTVTGEDGIQRDELVGPETVVPGDRLVFTTGYSNDGVEPVENFVVTNPIPKAVKLADESGSFMVSVDNGRTYIALAALPTVTVDNGEDGSRSARAEDATHIRWKIARIDPGSSGKLTYSAIVR